MSSSKSLYDKLVPKFIRKPIDENKVKQKIIDYYENLDGRSLTEDEKASIAHLKQNKLSVFPQSFPNDYNKSDIEVFKDEEKGLKYVHVDGKRLYFKKSSSSRGIRRNYNFLAIEQDPRSPHRYLTDTFDIKEGDVIADIGAAEGNLTLSVIEKVKKAYLFEFDERWIAPLKATFAPWKDKVEIVQMFVSDKNDEQNITLDEFLQDHKVDFIKVDAEGTEASIIQGAKHTIEENENLKIALCTYHKPNDAVELKETMEDLNFDVNFSDGLMIFTHMDFSPPYLRKGVLRAIKK